MATIQRNDGNQPQQQQQPQRPTERGTQEQPLARGALPRSPFGVMRRFMDEMDRMFSDFGGVSPGLFEREPAWTPQIELFEKDGKLVLRADLPGLKPDDVKVDVDRGVLTVSGERKREKKEEREGVYHSERFYGSFMRRIALPDDVDSDKIEARFENGVLEVIVPTPARPAGAKSIAVKSGGKG